ncbi:hypothetical protein [Heyndrickxia oleronia]|uniref:hypothetical protein n=1 Tax=Heyndrickxia oleronia TaxID=38875 RepID=UPI001C0F3498|nr:hypothetical protein [Heyndrickxia oleronia]MBU5214553.1 hypothetical protein [Heyndrickxia oleronia]
MTIISAVFVPEGIAMAADSRLTGHFQRDYGNEIFTITDNSQKLLLVRNETVGVSFCGDAILEGRTIADFIRLFDINEVETNDTVETIAYKLNRILENKYSQYEVSFFIAGFDFDQPFVYEVGQKKVIRMNVKENNNLYNGCIWHGEQEAIMKLFLGDNPTSFDFDLMPLKDAVDFAEYVVELTIKYQRFQDSFASCGGDIDLLVITKDYTKFVRHKILNPKTS